MDNTNGKILKSLLVIHGIITFAAGVILIAMPEAIPKVVDIEMSPKQYLLCYFLGAAELAIAYLSFFTRNIEDKKALRLICSTFIVFHLATGALEAFALMQGVSFKIFLNILLRIIIAGLFWYYGIYKTKKKE